MLLRVGTRGGMVPAWSMDPADFDYGFVDVSGMDLDARHHLCMADRGADELRVYRPSQSGDVPTVLAERLAVPGVHDCRWRRDGALSLLIDERVHTRAAASPAHDPTAFIAEDVTGGAFVKGPGVDLELVDPDVATFVGGPDTGFARVTFDQDAETFTSPWGTVELDSSSESPLSVVLRPDGRALVLPAIEYAADREEPLVIVDPSTPDAPTTYVALGAGGRGSGAVAVAVPWDRFVDPWTGAPLDPNDPFAPPGVGPPFPSPVAPPSGLPVTPSEPGPSDPDGCAGGGSTALTALALLLVRAVRRMGRARTGRAA